MLGTWRLSRPGGAATRSGLRQPPLRKRGSARAPVTGAAVAPEQGDGVLVYVSRPRNVHQNRARVGVAGILTRPDQPRVAVTAPQGVRPVAGRPRAPAAPAPPSAGAALAPVAPAQPAVRPAPAAATIRQR